MTDDNVTKFPSLEIKSPLFGPHPEYYSIVMDGRQIPHLTGHKSGDNETYLILDHRLSITVPNDLAYSVAWMLANAIAIGQGYSHLGAENKDRPFAPQVAEIDPSALG